MTKEQFILRDNCFYQQLLQQAMSPRPKNSHKGMFGRVLIIGGGLGMPGAVSLAALAALRVGAGMVTIATRPEHADKVLPFLPEALIYGVRDAADLNPLLAKATLCILGPGLGSDHWAKSLYCATVATQLPLVVDASALRLLALNAQVHPSWVLTPHPGEAAGLLGCSIDAIQSDRQQAALRIQRQYGGVVVLKGANTLICWGANEGDICTAGNPGMSSAGMGDVLSGILGGLLAQNLSLQDAARLAVWLHASAADVAVAADGERGLLASDLAPHVRRLIHSILKS